MDRDGARAFHVHFVHRRHLAQPRRKEGLMDHALGNLLQRCHVGKLWLVPQGLANICLQLSRNLPGAHCLRHCNLVTGEHHAELGCLCSPARMYPLRAG